MDGVPFVTQPPIAPGETFTYEFTAKPAGSHMYHSHHNATDQVGRGLLGAFIVEPKRPRQLRRAGTASTQDFIWITTTRWAASRSTATAFRPRPRSLPSWATRS